MEEVSNFDCSHFSLVLSTIKLLCPHTHTKGLIHSHLLTSGPCQVNIQGISRKAKRQASITIKVRSDSCKSDSLDLVSVRLVQSCLYVLFRFSLGNNASSPRSPQHINQMKNNDGSKLFLKSYFNKATKFTLVQQSTTIREHRHKRI